MRELDVLGLNEDGARIVCHDPLNGEEFSVAADEKLRAAARGDLSRIGQLEIELQSQLRPRDIQARIRAGASVAEVAKQAGTSINRIETFAHPVLMERSAMAARATVCMIDGSAITTPVRDVIAARLADLGQATEVDWDAHRAPDGWVLTARWSVGRSRNTAEFTYHPIAGGGTVIARNDIATELVRPERSPLRTVQAGGTSGFGRALVTGPTAAPAAPVLGKVAPTPASSSAVARDEPAADRTARIPDRDLAARTATEPNSSGVESDAEQLVADTVEDERAGARPDHSPREQIARTGTDHSSARPASRSAKSAKPSMPSWDDVLLGGTRKR
ncbi:septation protein SepH [Nakamurella sp. A5-74]|uniref:Septation protein SepH n=1 Tax=Nakamurella sp. A5-74 TaxID=3158264 RepID=A0AAU8DLN3_9ACTN